jgi:glutathione peroxidase-family protein
MNKAYPISKNEIMSFARKRMELEFIMLSKISQTEKDKHHMYSLIS